MYSHAAQPLPTSASDDPQANPKTAFSQFHPTSSHSLRPRDVFPRLTSRYLKPPDNRTDTMLTERLRVPEGIPLHRLWIFPVIAGTSWFVTLAAMLLTWVARGCPRYPGQRNPYIAFISDIAAFQLKPLFLIGGVTTAAGFAATMVAVHVSRYDPRLYGLEGDALWKKTASIMAMCSGIVAGLGLILLAILDTFRFHEEHAVLLLVCFLGLVSSMVLTTVVYWDQARTPSPFRRLRVYCIASAIIVFLDAGLGVSFYTLMQLYFWRVSGILEWVMAFTGAFYLWVFVGFVSVPAHGIDEAERRALLGETVEQ
ncbi:hypothetical protein BU23DRAFT_496338 [Bimuria novae-zelandiae CBS 107.79]|uniref:CWH43-like N-terminal domain-containing protein n=1 Tax=Bimuria novae-zelandiae CBS 107.79 TaxID=1447943 RepID=A0A6A5W2E4_9PLEO|nr:hypothetical protein BU23DRAFT_496338 [Bimuria novae-zelandiae CBS 107.79]